VGRSRRHQCRLPVSPQAPRDRRQRERRSRNSAGLERGPATGASRRCLQRYVWAWVLGAPVRGRSGAGARTLKFGWAPADAPVDARAPEAPACAGRSLQWAALPCADAVGAGGAGLAVGRGQLRRAEADPACFLGQCLSDVTAERGEGRHFLAVNPQMPVRGHDGCGAAVGELLVRHLWRRGLPFAAPVTIVLFR